MSTEYSDRKTREILSKVNGQAKLAEQAMRALCERDPLFLQNLVEPYLNGIIAHAIDRARKPTGLKEPKAAAPLPKKAAAPRQAKPLPSGGMGNLMQALAKSFEQNTPKDQPPAGKKVSQKHVDAMNALIKHRKK